MEGIDKIKMAVKTSLDIVLQYKEVTKDDGKITKLEYLSFVDELFAVVKTVPQAKTILKQLQDLDDAETIELIVYIESFGLLKEKAIIVLSNVLKALETLYDVYDENIVPIIEALEK